MAHDPLCICVRCLSGEHLRDPQPDTDLGPSAPSLAVRTFGEIAEEMGISPQRAYQLYASGMRKLSRRPHVLARLADVASLLAEERRLRAFAGRVS